MAGASLSGTVIARIRGLQRPMHGIATGQIWPATCGDIGRRAEGRSSSKARVPSVSPSSLYFRTLRRAPRRPLNASSMHSPRPLRSSWTDLTPRILMYAVARRTDRSGRGRTAGEREVMFDWLSALKPDSSAIYIPHEYRPIGSKPCRWRWLRLNAELRGRGEAPAMYSGTARRRAALEDLGCLVGVLRASCPDVEVGCAGGSS